MNLVKVGPAGGNSGTTWDEKGCDQVAGIVVTYNKYTVLALQFLFYENGNLVLSNKHGDHRCENFHAVLFDYSSEFITSIRDCFKTSSNATYLKTITFGTNKVSYGPFGGAEDSFEGSFKLGGGRGAGVSFGFGGAGISIDDLDFNFQLGDHRLFGGFHGSKTDHGIVSIGIYVKPIISSSINSKDPRVMDEKINSPSYKLSIVLLILLLCLFMVLLLQSLSTAWCLVIT